MRVWFAIITLLFAQFFVVAQADERDEVPTQIYRSLLPAMLSNTGEKNFRQDLNRLCEPCEKQIAEYVFTKQEIDNLNKQIEEQRSRLSEAYKAISWNEDKDGTDEYEQSLNHLSRVSQKLHELQDYQIKLNKIHNENYNKLIRCIYDKCMANDYDAGFTTYTHHFGVSPEINRNEISSYPLDGEFDIGELTYSRISIHYLMTITTCKLCKEKSREINQWILDNHDILQLPDNLKNENASNADKEAFRNQVRQFIHTVDNKRAELRQCEKQCVKKDKSHGAVLPDKKKIRYYAAAGATNLRTDDLKESIDAGKPIFAANGITGDFDSDTNDTGYSIAVGVEIPLESASLIDINVFYTDGVEIKGDVAGNAATAGGPFTFNSKGKQEIKSFGIEASYLKKITNNIFLGGGLGYKYFEIEDSSDVETTLNGVVTSNVSSGDTKYENVVSAQVEARINLTESLFINLEASRTLEEVGFNNEHITSLSTFIGLRF